MKVVAHLSGWKEVLGNADAINTIVIVIGEQNHSNFNEVLSYFCRSSVEVHSIKPSNLLPM